jgi:UDPglucose 6-dehydrogenase
VAHLAGGTADLALATDAINRRQVTRLTEMIGEMISVGGTVAVLGLSYKPSTPVIEESQGVMLAKALRTAGFAVVAHDPMAAGPASAVLGGAARVLPNAREALVQSDVAVIITPWPEYGQISPGWMPDGRTRFIIDCWRQLDPTSFANSPCKIVRLGHQETIAAASKQLAAE